MKSITSIPTPALWRSIVGAKTLSAYIQHSRASTGQGVDLNGKHFTVGNDVPVVDWLGAKCQGLKIEGVVTNLMKNSKLGFQNNNYGIEFADSTVFATTPHGTVTPALRESENIRGYTDHVIDITNAINNISSPKTLSFSIKPGVLSDDRKIGMYCVVAGARHYVEMRFLTNGSIVQTTSGSGGIFSDYGYKALGDGWYRVWLGTKNNVVITGLRVSLSSHSLGGGWSGSSVDYNYYFFLDDVQLEARAYPGDFLVTTGASVSKAPDVSRIELPTSQQHTVFIECQSTHNELLAASGALANSQGQYLAMMVYGGDDLARRGGFVKGSVGTSIASGQSTHATQKNTIYRQALSYDRATGEIKIAHDGQIQILNTKVAGLNFDRFVLGSNGNGGDFLDGYIRRFGYWPNVLSTEQMRQVTHL